MVRAPDLKAEVAGSSPALTTKPELFLGRFWFSSSVTLVNSQVLSFSLSGMPVNYLRVNSTFGDYAPLYRVR